MANFNKIILIGRLTRDPEIRAFGSGGKVAAFGFAVTNRRKNNQTGQWEDEPMFIDCDAFNWGTTGTLANVIEQYCRKGSQICIEGRLRLDTWDDKTTGQKRSKHKIVVEAIQLLDRRPDGVDSDGESAGRSTSRPAASAASRTGSSYGGPPPTEMESHGPSGSEEGDNIPF